MFEYGFPSLSHIRKYGLLEMPPPVGVSKINSCQNGFYYVRVSIESLINILFRSTRIWVCALKFGYSETLTTRNRITTKSWYFLSIEPV